MRQVKRLTIPAALILALLLVGCAAKNPNTVPTPAPIQVANSINLLAQSADAATSALIAARDQGKLSQADLNIARKVLVPLAVVIKQLNAELLSADPWDVQKTKMRQYVVSSGVAEFAKQLSPTARSIMLTCLTTFNAVSAGLGGPTI
jgi:type IV pilus biogenesis protein CpaD/CtpE